MTKYIDRYYLNGELYGIKFAGGGSGRQPGANTIAYYPLTSVSTVNDMKGSGTLYNLSNSGVTFGTYQGVDCASFTTNYYLFNNSFGVPSGKHELTVSFFVYFNSVSYSRALESCFSLGAVNNHTFCNVSQNPLGLTDYGTDVEVSGLTINSGEWYYYTFTAESGTNNWKIYVNGQQQTTTGGVNNYAGLSGSKFCINGFYRATGQYGIDGYMSEFIVEDKERTAQEVADYFNLTKSLYGIA